MGFHDDFHDDFRREVSGMQKGFVGLAIVTTALNLAFWGGLAYAVFWAAQHFGVIGG